MMPSNQKRPASEEPSPAGSPVAWCESYMRALDEQVRLLKELEGVGDEQRGLIAAEDPEPLLELMQRRQAVIDALERSHASSLPMKARLDEEPAMHPSTRAALRARLEEVSRLARAIMRRDAQDQEKLQARAKKTAAELAQLAGGQRASRAYAGSTGAEGAAFQDRRG